MPGNASAKPQIAVVGAGNLACALATRLYQAGYVIDQIISRKSGASSHRAERLAGDVGASAFVIGGGRKSAANSRTQNMTAEIVWFCVPDGAIAGAAQLLATAINWKGKVALHSSGALTSNELAVLRRRGAAVASVHPFMTFVRGSRPAFAGVPFALEGDRKATQAARAIVKNLGADAYSIRAEDKAAYHAWGTFASPLLTALFASSEQVASRAGVKPRTARQRMLPMLRQTLANYEEFGAAGAFSGPIIRGDLDTVKRHLRVLRGTPVALEVYISLARAAAAFLPGKNKKILEEALSSVRRRSSRR
jgi:predicted short-subunit dehydrogenase-like oxidoreductase (DUF2520 family)